ncbi:glycine betaine ABC transporter substrate-binding protein [Desulfosporosinus sp.]|uniref:glycine betaine ABC transporter substrate-binding protein n=1 Tax=Desulfosporosinus sp. TaxID=157907 RepID=UPI000E869D77|nr:glycine betaine ABC transporter substrate-binding protein [Desulfosporosinus sp.]MBC2721139.1 glycine betaine ABC transporter substrate-binding protein [Desulfosporosinus sp.]MBC2725538.1 glycine betaine ABC transporter substrate-binding protein [Desulfosporosinus sp.]HBV88199.1 glycine/betaine ABC transporter substrate-binding protein [Desulfosporosinus sp.]
MLRKIKCITVCLLMLFVVIVGGCAPGDKDAGKAGKETIKIGQVPFEHEWIPVNIIKRVAEELGYSTEIKEGDVGIIFLGLSRGDIDIYPDVWLPTVHSSYMEQYKGQIELVGTLYKNAPTGWAVPTYVDINSIDELKGKSQLFGAKIIGAEPGAGMMEVSRKVIKEYGLDYTLVEGSTPAMLATVKKAIQSKDPIVFLAWRPHTMFQDFDIKILKDPKNIWSVDDARNGVNPGLKEKAPDLYKFLSNFQISIDEIESMMVEMGKGEKVDKLAEKWINNNRDKVNEWLGK